MWDDPLFNRERKPAEAWELNDQEFIELRRQQRLLFLELLYIKLSGYRRQAGYWYWIGRQLNRRIIKIIPPERREQYIGILHQLEVDAGVQEMLGFDYGSHFDQSETTAD